MLKRQPHNPQISFINLGCAKNLVDAEHLITRLTLAGYEIVTNYNQADIVIINTCGFINAAIRESLETIADALNQHGKVIVTGCLGTNKKLILKHYPQVLHISGPNQPELILETLQKLLPQPTSIPEATTIPAGGIKLTPQHFSYLKISEGCNHSCSFCIIPQLRGKLVSRPMPEIITAAQELVANGTKELIIIAQDTTAYGADCGQQNLLSLVTALAKLNIWIRLHYLYPDPNIEALLPLMQTNKILPYLDIPLQHINPRILKLMRRPGAKQNLLDRITKWRTICPNLTIRSTFIVGFPSETEQEFRELIEFIIQAKLDHIGCFKYSNVAGAAANNLPEHLPESIKQERQDILMQIQAEISTAKLQHKIGTKQTVLIDEIQTDAIIGRTEANSPEIDGIVHIATKNSAKLNPGDFVQVTIDAADEYDLFGHIVGIE